MTHALASGRLSRGPKTAIKRLARRFGVEITRYPPEAPTRLVETDVTKLWVEGLKAKGPVRVVLDVGANAGDTVRAFRTVFPESIVYAFDPTPSVLPKLQEKFKDDPRVRIYPTAVGEYDGTTTIRENVANTTNSLLVNSGRIGEFAPAALCQAVKTTDVQITRLDSFCARELIRNIDILKVDAQGYEGPILTGLGNMLTPACVRTLFLEVLFVDLYEKQTWFGEILEMLRPRGYRLFGITNIAVDEVNGWKWADAVFVADH